MYKLHLPETEDNGDLKHLTPWEKNASKMQCKVFAIANITIASFMEEKKQMFDKLESLNMWSSKAPNSLIVTNGNAECKLTGLCCSL